MDNHDYCCDMMADIIQGEDEIIKYIPKFREYGIPVHDGGLNPYPLSSQKIGSFKVDLSPVNAAVGTEGARRATGVPTATPYTSAGLR